MHMLRLSERERHFAFPYSLMMLQHWKRRPNVFINEQHAAVYYRNVFESNWFVLLQDLPMDFLFIHYYSSWQNPVRNDPWCDLVQGDLRAGVKALIPYLRVTVYAL